MKIAHISDTHVSFSDAFNRTALDIVIEQLNNGDFDLVIHTGDITDQGLKEEYELAACKFSKLNKPFLVVPGNHDMRNVGDKLFKQFFHFDKRVFEFGDIGFVLIDTTAPDVSSGRIDPEEFDFLEKNLNRIKEKKVKVVVGHHHLIPIPDTGKERNVILNSGDLIELFREFGIDLYLCGHKHMFNVYRLDDIFIVNTGCVSCKKTRKGEFNSFNILNIDTDNGKLDICNCYLNGVTESSSFDLKKSFFYISKEKKSPDIDSFSPRLRIVHVAGTFFSDRVYFKKDILLKAIERINKINPDVVVHCGNLVDAGIQRYFESLAKIFSLVKVRILTVPGVNDFTYIGNRIFTNYFRIDEVSEIKGYRFLGLNTVQKDLQVGTVGTVKLKKLDESLKCSNHNVVFMHHSLLPIPNTVDRGYLEDAGDVLKTLTKNNVSFVLSGYGGNTLITRVENTIFVNASYLSWELNSNLNGYTFMLIDIFKNHAIIKEICVETAKELKSYKFFFSELNEECDGN